MKGHYRWLSLTGAALASGQAWGAVAVYNGTDAAWAAWSSAVPAPAAITFAELPPNTQVTDQYASLGIRFTDAEGDWIWPNTNPIFPQDGWGLRGFQVVEMIFDTPMSAFGTVHPGIQTYKFYSGSTLLYQSAQLGNGGGSHFTGFTVDTPFDRVVVTGMIMPPPFDSAPVDFDSVYFSTVPGPGAALLILGLPLSAARRRRR